MDGTYKNGLSRWARQTNQKVQSRAHRVTSNDDIHDWIKTVEEASNKATDVAFGVIPPGKQRGKAVVELRTGLVRNHEQAYTEAQELLTQWVNEKLRFDVDDGFDDLEAWRRAREAKHNKSTADRMLDDNEDFSIERLTRLALEDDVEIDEAAIYERVKRSAMGDSDPYANLYEMEEKAAVNTVLQNMLSKEVVKETFKKDLGFNNSVSPDPRTKMELRHNMVKENREKRQKEEERKKMMAQIKKEARLKAQQLILKEQKDRETRARKEDMALKKEMIMIRKEMHDERTLKAEEMRKVREEKEMLDRLAHQELERQMASEEKQVIQFQQLENDRRKKQVIKMEMVKAKIASQNLQCLHRHLTAWYDLVLSKRLLMGKVKAMSDWKLMLKVWGAWRSHVRGLKLEVETEIHERSVIDAERKKVTAERHYTHSVLRRCFLAWHQFINEQIERRELETEQERTKSKMLSLLNAVAEGRMWKEDGETEEDRRSTSRLTSARSNQHTIDSQKVKPVRKQAWVEEESVQTSCSEISLNRINSDTALKASLQNKSKGRSLPTQPWQVGRQHLKLTKTEILNLRDVTGQQGGGCTEQQHTDYEIRKKFGTQPWMKRHFVVNNLEHRYTAQQQTLNEQKDQIKEQRRLIEELQYEQRQQALRQHLVMGPQVPLPPTPVECEVPPPGNQIPRGENETKQNIDDRKGNRANHNKSNNAAVTLDLTSAGVVIVHDKINTVDTGRDCPSTSRTDHSAATGATRTSVSAIKSQNTRYLKVLKNIEDRAAERAKLKAEREERKRKQEEEKLAQLQKLEEETAKAIEAEKKVKAEAYRQKKRLEKEKEIEKQKQQSRLEEMNRMAEEHYTRSVLKYRGLLPFKKIVSLAKRNWAVAVKHRDREILRQCLKAWRQFADDEANQKKSMADQMHQFLVTKHLFQRWKNYKHHMKFLLQRAARHYQDNLRCRLFMAWVGWAAVEREETLNKMELAHTHYLQSLLKNTFLSWRHLPEQLKREEERQKRKLELRQRVAELIPDFQPHVSVTVKDSDDLS